MSISTCTVCSRSRGRVVEEEQHFIRADSAPRAEGFLTTDIRFIILANRSQVLGTLLWEDLLCSGFHVSIYIMRTNN